MKRVIKHQKKMKNTMYIVFGVFALALLIITRANPSYASDGLILDDALDMIAGGSIGGEVIPEEQSEIDEELVEGEDNEESQDLNDKDLLGEDGELGEKGEEGDEGEENQGEGKQGEELDDTEDNIENNTEGNKENNGEENIEEEDKDNGSNDKIQNEGNDVNEDRHGVTDENGGETVDGGLDNNGQEENKEEKENDIDEKYGFKVEENEGIENNVEIIESEEIYGTGKYEGVKVDVYAPEGAFPKGTILSIIPITGDNEMNDIQDVLEEQKNVEKTEKLVAFDITFRDPNTNEELQPLTGTVQVSFNYAENEELKAAEEDENQEVKIYHLNDKDEKGEKVEEIKDVVVEEVVVNEEESGEVNVMVVEAETFSIYAIIKSDLSDVIAIKYNANGGKFKSGNPEVDELSVLYTKQDGIYKPNINVQAPYRDSENMSAQSGWMFAGWYTTAGEASTQTTEWFGQVSDTTTNNITVYAKWLPFNDLILNVGGQKVILMDRNMGAEGVASGNFYPNGGQEDDSVLGFYYQWGNNYGFKSTGDVNKYRLGSNPGPDVTSYGSGNFYSDSTYYLRDSGNYSSWYSISGNGIFNLWGGENGQGPCPEGYYIPGYWERGDILKYVKNEMTNNQEFCSGIESSGECFSKKLKLPRSGTRDKATADPIQKGQLASYWSSKQYSNYAGYRIFFADTIPDYADNVNNRYGSNVRCFRKKMRVIFVNDGEIVQTNYIDKDALLEANLKPTDPIKESFAFEGWFNGDEKFDFSKKITEDVVLTAKWSKLPMVSFNANGGIFEDGKDTKNMLLKYVNVPKGSRYQTEIFTISGAEELILDIAISPGCAGDVIFSGVYNSVTGGIYGSPSGEFVPHRYIIYGDTVYIKVSGGTSSCTKYFGGIIYSSVKNPIYEGKDFDGWYTEDEEKWEISSETGDVGLVAHWKDPVVIKYDANGGYFDTGNTTTGTIDVVYMRKNGIYSSSLGNNSLQAPNKENYMFVGWYTTQTNQVIGWSGIVNDTTESQTVYAKWLPFNDLDVKDLNGNVLFTIMDRNLGAEAYMNETGKVASQWYGYYYQWGNNYGFPNTGSITTSRFQANITGKGYGPGNYYSSGTFVKDSYRWDKDTSNATYSNYGNLNLWGGEKTSNLDRDRQGPCPKGYHVPDVLEWKAAREIWCMEKMETSATCYNGGTFRDDLKLPFAGYRNYKNANVSQGSQGSYGRYWSSSPNPSNANYSYILYFDSFDISPQYSYYRAYGCSVRCFKDSQTTKTLTFSVLNQVISTKNLKWRESVLPGLAPENPERDNAEFIGRFENGSEKSFEFGSGTYLNRDINLYAKFKCNIGYVEASDGKSCEKIKINFYLDSSAQSAVNLYKSVIPQIVGIEGRVTKISHTPNLDDEGNFVTKLGDGLWLSSNETGFVGISNPYSEEVSINGNNELNVSIKYRGRPNGRCGLGGGNGITIYSGKISENIQVMQVNSNQYPIVPDYSYNEIKIQGDTVSFYSIPGCPSYGYYAIIEGTRLIDVVKYDKSDFDNIQDPYKTGYTFLGWYYTGLIEEFNSETVSTGIITNVYAKWECADGYEDRGGNCIRESKTSNYSGGGGKKSSDTSDSQNHNSAEEKELSGITIKDPENNTQADFLNKSEEGEVIKTTVKNTEIVATVKNTVHLSSSSYTKEQNDAYSFAKSNGLTTTESIEDAKMNTELTRIQMAKMLSNFAINVLGQEPDASKGVVKFNDVSNKLDKQYDNGVTLAYQLGIMGINMKNNNFRPYDEVTRAEFVTALSRMLYHIEDGKGKMKYYEPHMVKLYNEGIITNTNPKLKEMRGYVMLMLMRSVK